MATFVDMTGKRFGKWVVLGRSPDRNGNTAWFCRCDCGTIAPAIGMHLRAGRSTNCGCVRRASLVERRRTHGGAARGGRRSREYRIWAGAKARCTNPNNAGFQKWYGARGIAMCERWLESFEAFLEDMGTCPPGHSIDRIDNDGNYEPGNCRWATSLQQAQNRRSGWPARRRNAAR